MFTDIQTIYNGNISNQYFSDISHSKEQNVIHSPIAARYVPIPFKIYPELTSHAFSIIKQASKLVLPWHIPTIGFQTTMDTEMFERLSKNG